MYCAKISYLAGEVEQSMDARISSVEDVRSELESHRRDLACLMRQMRQVTTTLSKIRGFDVESHEIEVSPAALLGTKENESQDALASAEDVQQLSNAPLQRQSSTYFLGGEYLDIL